MQYCCSIPTSYTQAMTVQWTSWHHFSKMKAVVISVFIIGSQEGAGVKLRSVRKEWRFTWPKIAGSCCGGFEWFSENIVQRTQAQKNIKSQDSTCAKDCCRSWCRSASVCFPRGAPSTRLQGALVNWSKFCKILEISWQVLSGNIIFSSGCPLNI